MRNSFFLFHSFRKEQSLCNRTNFLLDNKILETDCTKTSNHKHNLQYSHLLGIVCSSQSKSNCILRLRSIELWNGINFVCMKWHRNNKITGFHDGGSSAEAIWIFDYISVSYLLFENVCNVTVDMVRGHELFLLFTIHEFAVKWLFWLSIFSFDEKKSRLHFPSSN